MPTSSTSNPATPQARFFGVPLMTGLMSEFTSVALCPEGRHFATIGDGSTLSVADRTTMKRFVLGSLTHASQVAFRPKNIGNAIEMAIVGAKGESHIQRFDLRSEQLLEPLAMGAATAVAYSTDGLFVAAGNINGLVRVWRLDPSGPVQVAEEEFFFDVTSIAFHPLNSAVYATLTGKVVELPIGPMPSGALARILETTTTPYHKVAAGSSGTYVYFAADEVVHVYDTFTGEMGQVTPNVGRIRGVQVFPNSGYLCIHGDRVVSISPAVGPNPVRFESQRCEYDDRIYAVSELDNGVALVFHSTLAGIVGQS